MESELNKALIDIAHSLDLSSKSQEIETGTVAKLLMLDHLERMKAILSGKEGIKG